MKPNFKVITGILLGLAAAIIGCLTAFNAVHWSSSQTTLVSTAVAAIITFVVAVFAHFWPGTKAEPVALAASFTAAVSAVLALGTGFSWWHLNAQQTAALVSLISAFIGIGSALLARNLVIAPVTGGTPAAKAAFEQAKGLVANG